MTGCPIPPPETAASEISRRCVAFAAGLDLAEVPPAVIDHAKQCLLDWIGCAVRGATTPEAGIIHRHIAAMGGQPQASAIGAEHPNSVFNATLCNAYLGHIIEFDDVDKDSITHPGTVVVPGALALGQWRGAGGRELLTAMIAGYEVMLRVGAAITPAHYRIWHTTATAGVFGSAISAGRMLGLAPDALAWAFGHAGSMAGGLWEFLRDGAMTKYLHAGKAAANGVLAALLAREGLSGASHILEGPQGFFAGYARQAVDPALFDDFGQRYRTQRVSFKPYPCCRHTHSSIDCGLALHEKLAAAPGIERIRLETYGAALQVAGIEDPRDSRQAQFSLKYCLATALAAGRVTIDSFAPDRLADPAVRRLMELIEPARNEALDRATPDAWPARLTIRLADGGELATQVDCPKGDPENPLSWAEVEDKFLTLAEAGLGNNAAHRLIDMCRNIETLEQCGSIMQEAKLNA